MRSVTRLLESGSMPSRRPVLRKNYRSNVRDLYIIGDLAGAPVIKLAMEQGYEVIEHIASLPDARSGHGGDFDLLIVGAGAAGLNAALEAKQRGLRAIVLEKSKLANTIEDFPEGKWVYAEPDSRPARGKLWLDGARKEDLVARWHAIVRDNGLDVRTEEAAEAIEREGGLFRVRTAKAEYTTRRVILAMGMRGNPRRLGVPGEEQERVYHRLYSPGQYRDERVLVVGGGNSAVEAALTLSERNDVTLSYRQRRFSRVFKDNRRKLDQAVETGRIRLLLESNVREFGDRSAVVDVAGREQRLPFDHAFVLVGAELPVAFLQSVGVRLENEWTGNPWIATLLAALSLGGLALFGPDVRVATSAVAIPTWLSGLVAFGAVAALIGLGLRGNRYAWLGLSFVIWYTVYGAKLGDGQELFPFRGWGYEALSFFERPWAFWYTVLYTALMTVFGLQAMKRWGFDRNDRFQIWRYVSLLAFQWVFFFLIPEFLFQWAVEHRWVGEALAEDPSFAGQAWRSYGIVYAWPLFFYTFFYDPHQVWVVWGVILTFGLVPLLAVFHGKRYCSWICGCGGLAETFGDRWRHLAPKGRASIRWEWMNTAVLIFATVVTVGMLARDVYLWLRGPAEGGLAVYRIFVDVWLVGILPVTLYPFLGGKIWCRYWCPLAKLMGIVSSIAGKFKITANDKCIGCTECSRQCQVGIDVMDFALKQEVLDNKTSSCIGCGICVTVCPMDVLSFGEDKTPQMSYTEGGRT